MTKPAPAPTAPPPVAPVALPVAAPGFLLPQCGAVQNRAFAEVKSGEYLITTTPGVADNVIDFQVSAPLTNRRIYAYTYTPTGAAPQALLALVRFWLNGSVVGEFPIGISLQPTGAQSFLTPLRSGGSTEDVLICYLTNLLSGEFSTQGLNPGNFSGEIDRVTVSIQKSLGLSAARIIVAVVSQNPKA